MDEQTTTVEDLSINQRFLLAGQSYLVVNVEYIFDFNHYVVTARSQDTVLYTMLELKIQPRSPFRTLA